MTQPPSSDPSNPQTPIPPIAAEQVPPGREPLRHLLIGSPKGVISTIHNLHRLGYAEVGIWSPLLPTPNPGEVMAILTRYVFTADSD